MATAPSEIDEIRRSMAQIRRDLHADVQGVVEGAEAATDWRRYVRSYPFATLGLALTVGYLIVPHRRKATTVVNVPSVGSTDPMPYIKAEAARSVVPEKKGKGLLGVAFGLVAPVALRAAQGYALQFFEQWLAQKMSQQLQMPANLASAFGGQPETPAGPGVRPPGTPRF